MTILDLLASLEPLGVAPFFQGRGTVLLVVLGTLFFAGEVALFSWLWVRVAPLAVDADSIERAVDRLEGRFQGRIASKEVWEREVLHQLTGSPRLRTAVRGFLDQCWTRGDEIWATRPVRDFLDGLSEAGIDRRVLAIPSALTAVGILGTFIGITVGLQQFHRAIPEVREPPSIADPQAAVAGSPAIPDPVPGPLGEGASSLSAPPALPWTEVQIGTLVESLGLSFRTSIWGLLLSLLALGRLETVAGRHRRAVARLAGWLDEAMPRIAPENIVVDLHDHLGERLEQAIAGKGGLAETLRDGLQAVVGSQAEVLRSVVTEFRQGLEAHLEEWLTSVTDSLERGARSAESFQQAMNALLARLEGSAARIHQLLGTAEESIERSRGAIEAAAASLKESMDAAKDVLQGLLRSFEERDSVLSDHLRALEGLRSDVERLRGRIEGDRKAVSELATTLQSRIEGLTAVLDRLVAWHGKLDEEVGRHLESWRAVVAEQSDLLEGVGEITKSVTDSVDGLETLAREAGAAAERFVELVGGLDRVSRGLADAGSGIGKAVDRLSKVHEVAMRRWTEAAGSLGAAATLVEKGLRTYAQNVNQSLETVLRQFDEELGRAVQGIGRAIGTLTDFLDDLSESIQRSLPEPPTEEEE